MTKEKDKQTNKPRVSDEMKDTASHRPQERDRSVAWLDPVESTGGRWKFFSPLHRATLGQSQVQEMKPIAYKY